MNVLDFLASHATALWTAAAVLVLPTLYKWLVRLFGVVMVADDSIGTVTKRFVLFGSQRELPPGRIVAVLGEAGLAAHTLAPGIHFFLWPWQHTVVLAKFTVVPDGPIGVIEACDGAPLPDDRVAGRDVDGDNFQDARLRRTWRHPGGCGSRCCWPGAPSSTRPRT